LRPKALEIRQDLDYLVGLHFLSVPGFQYPLENQMDPVVLEYPEILVNLMLLCHQLILEGQWSLKILYFQLHPHSLFGLMCLAGLLILQIIVFNIIQKLFDVFFVK